MNSKTHTRKMKRFNDRKEAVKLSLNNKIDIEILMLMDVNNIKKLVKAIGKVKGLKKSYDSLNNININESIATDTDTNTEEEKEEEPMPEIEPIEIELMPEQGLPEQGLPEQGSPEQGLPEQGSPEQGSPEQGLPEQGSPQQGSPEESKLSDILTADPEEYDLILLNKIIKKYNPCSLKVKEEFFKTKEEFIIKLIKKYKNVKTVEYYKNKIDMSEFKIYDTVNNTLNNTVNNTLQVYKTERPDYTINTDNVDEYIDKNNIYLNRKRQKKADKKEFMLLNDILNNIKNNIQIEEKQRILIEKNYCKDSIKQDIFKHYYNENF